MARVDCVPPFSHALYHKCGPGGHEYAVLAVRGTFRFTNDTQPLALADTQQPIRWNETYAGGGDATSQARCIVDDSDLVIGKPTTDVHVTGTLRPPDGKPRTCWEVRTQVGPVDKRLRVWGNRHFKHGVLGWKLSSVAPVAEVPLDYRLAFGGCYTADLEQAETSAPPAACLAYATNPAGCGWLPGLSDYFRVSRAAARQIKSDFATRLHMPAPQLEDPHYPVRSPHDRVPPAGFGPIARWWQPRIDRQGTLDDAWLEHRYPEWPDDFDYHFYNSAPPGLISPEYLRGDEPVILDNCLAGSRPVQAGSQLYCHRTRLPGLAVKALAEHRSGEKTVTPLVLDTVSIDLDRQDVSLTWRALFPPQDPVRRLIVAATALPPRRSA